MPTLEDARGIRTSSDCSCVQLGGAWGGALRMGRHKLSVGCVTRLGCARNYNATWAGNADTDIVTLYDLAADPAEETDLAGEEQVRLGRRLSVAPSYSSLPVRGHRGGVAGAPEVALCAGRGAFTRGLRHGGSASLQAIHTIHTINTTYDAQCSMQCFPAVSPRASSSRGGARERSTRRTRTSRRPAPASASRLFHIGMCPIQAANTSSEVNKNGVLYSLLEVVDFDPFPSRH